MSFLPLIKKTGRKNHLAGGRKEVESFGRSLREGMKTGGEQKVAGEITLVETCMAETSRKQVPAIDGAFL